MFLSLFLLPFFSPRRRRRHRLSLIDGVLLLLLLRLDGDARRSPTSIVQSADATITISFMIPNEALLLLLLSLSFALPCLMKASRRTRENARNNLAPTSDGNYFNTAQLLRQQHPP